MAGMGSVRQARVTAAVVAAAVAVSLAGAAVSLWCHAADGQSLLSSALSAAVVVAFTAGGAVVASARPANPVGWLMLAGGLAWSLGNAGVDAGYRGIVAASGAVPAASAWAVSGSALRGVGWLVVTVAVAMLFPDGRVAGPRWRWLPRVLVVAAAGSVAAVLTASDANLNGFGTWRNPIALPSWAQPLSGLLSLTTLLLAAAATLAAVAQLTVRWRRGGPLERQQLTLFGAAAMLPVVVAPLELAGVVGSWLFSAAALPLPLAIGFAVLARGLYDLRTAVNRTLVWGTLSAVVAGVYALVIAGLGRLLDAAGAAWLPWAAAAVVAVSFAPLRDELQRAVNRLTFGRWDEPYDVLAGLGQRLEASAAVSGLLADVVAELRALGLQEVTIADERGHVLAGDARASAEAVELPLSAYGQPVGSLCYRLPMRGLRARDRRLLEDLAGHLGGVLHAHRLTGDLQRALEGLVLAREEERRRLRRDLHDGLGPALAGHLLRLDLIAGTLDRDSAAGAELEALREELRATVLEVRRVVEGLRPPALDELGLTGALTQATQRLTAVSPLAVDLQIGPLPDLPAAVEVATFRIVTEAVTNTVRHAEEASTCRITIDEVEERLRIVVSDDGPGINSATPSTDGHGLQTMRERAEELRGLLRISSSGGTTIVAELPLPSPLRPLRTEPTVEAVR